MKKILTTLLISFITLSSFAQKIKMNLAPELNKPFKYEMISKMDIEGPQTVIMDMIMIMDMTYSTLEDSLINVSAKYSSIKVDLDAGMMTASYDSSKEPSTEMEKMFASQFKPLLENTMTYTTNKLGQIKNIDFPNVSEQLFDKNSLNSFGTPYPAHAISIGDTWTGETKMEQFNLQAKATYKLVEKNAEGYKIESSVVMEDATGNNVGNTTASFIVDPTTFTTISSSTSTSISMQGATIKNTTELKLVK